MQWDLTDVLSYPGREGYLMARAVSSQSHMTSQALNDHDYPGRSETVPQSLTRLLVFYVVMGWPSVP